MSYGSILSCTKIFIRISNYTNLSTDSLPSVFNANYISYNGYSSVRQSVNISKAMWHNFIPWNIHILSD